MPTQNTLVDILIGSNGEIVTIGPLILPSLPTTIFLFSAEINFRPNAAVYFTMSNGDKVSPGFPPIVPRMPEILLINATGDFFR